MSMRLVPAADHATSYTHLRTPAAGAPSAPGLHDTLRSGLGPSTTLTTALQAPDVPASRHPLESRLKAWEATQESLRMESLRKTYGMAEPIRRAMELKTVREGAWRPMALGGAGLSGAGKGGAAAVGSGGVHEDVLRGREATIDWEDVYTGEETRGVVGVHEEMERKLKI
ncbi:proteasome maturation factor [Xylariaceae sp. FL0016]|nr:proteasome maturation factor [Xylariaceae sp. FL0016]